MIFFAPSWFQSKNFSELHLSREAQCNKNSEIIQSRVIWFWLALGSRETLTGLILIRHPARTAKRTSHVIVSETHTALHFISASNFPGRFNLIVFLSCLALNRNNVKTMNWNWIMREDISSDYDKWTWKVILQNMLIKLHHSCDWSLLSIIVYYGRMINLQTAW